MIKASDGDLEKSIESCEHWEWYGGGLVFAGVAAAVAIATIHPLYDSFLEQWGSAIADSLVAVGVASEIRFGQMAGLRHGELKRRSDEKIAEANKVAAKAIKDAAEARERTAEVEKLTAWRHVDSDFRSNITAAFSNKSFVLHLAIEYESGDSEAFSLAREFAQIFTDCGNEQIIFRSNSHLNMTVFGVTVRVGMCEQSDAISDACSIAFGFAPAPVDLTPTFGHGVQLPDLYIFVGPKPPPELNLQRSPSAEARESSI